MSSSDYEDDEDGYYNEDDYYQQSDDEEYMNLYMENCLEKQKKNIEFFEIECITLSEAKSYFQSIIESVCSAIQVSSAIAKLLLISTKWDDKEIVSSYEIDKDKFLDSKQIKPLLKSAQTNVIEEFSTQAAILNEKPLCDVCLQAYPITAQRSLCCGHSYCKDCWKTYLDFCIKNGQATNIECMFTDCPILVPEDFIHPLLSDLMKEKFDRLSLRDCIDSNPLMRLCVSAECDAVIKAKESKAKRVICQECNNSYCFKCGAEYHAPTDCKTIKLWMTKCADDSETAHYISAHTKDCPNCNMCIEKNGGCNHMSCYSCKFEFCWMCLGAWTTHGSQYYDCSKYRENPNIANEAEQAREALKKYLFYYERWDNHMRSLRLEGKTFERIKWKINEKVMSNCGTWIDWQYLLNAAQLLAKCRYTLQYTYPYAYYMEPGANKSLFEYQQAKLEAEIENLSWKIEHAETTDRGDLESQMVIVEKQRTTLLEDFFL